MSATSKPYLRWLPLLLLVTFATGYVIGQKHPKATALAGPRRPMGAGVSVAEVAEPTGVLSGTWHIRGFVPPTQPADCAKPGSTLWVIPHGEVGDDPAVVRGQVMPARSDER